MVELIPYLTFTSALFACALSALAWLEARAAATVRTPEGWSLAVRADDPEFRQMVRSHKRHVRAVLRRRGVPPRDLDDAVQEVWLAVYHALAREIPRDVRRWLTGFARRIASNYRQKRKPVLVDGPVLEPIAGHDPGAEEQVMALDSLAALEPRCRAVMLAHIEGYTVREIARRLGIGKDTVVSLLRISRMTLRDALAH
jgi:RNA polymerase sigma factor (sigma-70 family)